MCVNCEMCVRACVCVCVQLSYPNQDEGKSDLEVGGGVNDYAVTAAVNPSDRLGGMNTCDHRRAREHVGKPQNMHTHMQGTKIVAVNRRIAFPQQIC